MRFSIRDALQGTHGLRVSCHIWVLYGTTPGSARIAIFEMARKTIQNFSKNPGTKEKRQETSSNPNIGEHALDITELARDPFHDAATDGKESTLLGASKESTKKVNVRPKFQAVAEDREQYLKSSKKHSRRKKADWRPYKPVGKLYYPTTSTRTGSKFL